MKIVEKLKKSFAFVATVALVMQFLFLGATPVTAAITSPYFKGSPGYVRENNSGDLSAYIMVPTTTTQVNFFINDGPAIMGSRNNNVISGSLVEYRLYTSLPAGQYGVTAEYFDSQWLTVPGSAVVYSLDSPKAEWVYPNNDYQYFRTSDNPLRLKIEDEYQQFKWMKYEINGTSYDVYRDNCDLRAEGSYVLCDVDTAANWIGLPDGSYRTYSTTYNPYPTTAQVRVTTYTKANNRFNPSDFLESNEKTKSRLFYVDSIAPTISNLTIDNINLTYPILSKTIKASVLANDNMGIKNVEFYVTEPRVSDGACDGNGIHLASAVSNALNLSGKYEVTVDTSALNGNYCLNAIAEDMSSSHSSILKQQILLDNTAPVVNLDDPTATFVRGTIDIKGTVTDEHPHHYYLVIKNTSGQVKAKVDSDGTINRTDSFTNELLWQFDTTTLADGNYVIDLEARDSANNKDANSVKTHAITIDNTPPTINFVSPTPADGLLTAQNSQTLKIETDDDVTSCTVDLGLGTGNFESGDLSGWTTGGNASWRISSDTINGSYSAQSGNMWGWNNVQSWFSREIDVPSNTNITFWQKVSSEGGWDYLRFYIDGNQQSAISGWRDWHQVSFPISAGHHTIMWNYTKDYSVTSGLDSGFIDDVQIGGVALGLSDVSMINNGAGTWTYGPVSLPDGPRNYTTTCVDHVGNTTTTDNRTLTVDTTAPSVPNLLSPSNDSYVNGATLTNDWSDSPEADTHHYIYESYRDAAATQLRWSQTINAPNSQKTASNVTNTVFWWRVKSVDNLGNTSAWSNLWKVTVDNDDPETSIQIIDNVGPDDGYVNDYYLNIQASASDAISPVMEYKLFDLEEGEPSEWRTYEGDIDTWIFAYNYWDDGTKTIKFMAKDAAGNISETTDSIILDATAPTSTVDTLPRYINTEMFNVEITSDDLAPTLNVRGFVEGPVLTEEQGSGVQYVELWYRKDGSTCPLETPSIAAFMPTRSEECVDGYVRYPGDFDPTQPIEFDTSITGGDGFYEFFSAAVDNAGNREETPIIFTLLRIVEEDSNLDEVMPDTSTNVDTKAPVITLNGGSAINLTAGDTFTDPGATTDDGSPVVVTGTVSTGIVGSYLLTYDSADNAGNKAISVTRTVSVAEAVVIPRLTTFVAETPAVQGATNPEEETVTPLADGPEVQGAAADNETEDGVNAWQKFFGYKVFGIKTWMWLLFFALVMGGWWFLMTDRKKKRT